MSHPDLAPHRIEAALRHLPRLFLNPEHCCLLNYADTPCEDHGDDAWHEDPREVDDFRTIEAALLAVSEAGP